MLRLLFFIAFGYVIYRLLLRKAPRGAPHSRVDANRSSSIQELVQDPVTKTYIPKEEAIEYHGRFFSSQKSLEQFKEQQDQNV